MQRHPIRLVQRLFQSPIDKVLGHEHQIDQVGGRGIVPTAFLDQLIETGLDGRLIIVGGGFGGQANCFAYRSTKAFFVQAAGVSQLSRHQLDLQVTVSERIKIGDRLLTEIERDPGLLQNRIGQPSPTCGFFGTDKQQTASIDESILVVPIKQLFGEAGHDQHPPGWLLGNLVYAMPLGDRMRIGQQSGVPQCCPACQNFLSIVADQVRWEILPTVAIHGHRQAFQRWR